MTSKQGWTVMLVCGLWMTSGAACGPAEGELDSEPAGEAPAALPSGAGEAAEARGTAPVVPESSSCQSRPEFSVGIPEVRVAGRLPVAHGGPLPSGLHVQIAHEIYTGEDGPSGPTGRQRRHSMRITAWGHRPHFNDVASVDGAPMQQRTFSMRATGTSLTISQICPAPEMVATFGYTILGDKLLIIDPATSSVATYQRQ